MIDRPDWNDGGSDDAAAVVTTRAVSRPQSIARPDWSVPAENEAAVSAEDRAAAMDPATGLPATFVQELSRSADGLEGSLDWTRASADRVLASVSDREGFITHFDKLSPGLQAKALHALYHHSRLDLVGLVDAIEPKLTLAEEAEASRWLREARAFL